MADEEGELAEPATPTPYSTPPEPEQPPQGPGPTFRSAPEAAVPMNAPPPMPPPPPPKSTPAKPRTRPATQEDLEKTAGFELFGGSSRFRAGGVVVLAGAALLVVQHLLVLLRSLQFGSPFIQSLLGGGAGNLQPSQEDIVSLLASISTATRLDLIGFGLLGIGCILVALGSRGLQSKKRSTGELRRVPGWAVGCGVGAGGCFLAWVVLSVQVRTLLTGSPTGDWSGSVGSVFGAFGPGGSGGPSGLPAQFYAFVTNFTAAGTLWIAASAMLLAGAVLLYLFARGLRGATGMKPGLGVLLPFGVTSVIAIWFFVAAFGLVFASAIAAAATGGQVGDVIGQVLVSLIIGVGGKLFLLPLEGTLLFLIVAFAGKRIVDAKPGRVYISKGERKEIAKRIKAGEQIQLDPELAPPGQAPPPGQPLAIAAVVGAGPGTTSLPANPGGDVVVTIGGSKKEPPGDGL